MKEKSLYHIFVKALQENKIDIIYNYNSKERLYTLLNILSKEIKSNDNDNSYLLNSIPVINLSLYSFKNEERKKVYDIIQEIRLELKEQLMTSTNLSKNKDKFNIYSKILSKLDLLSLNLINLFDIGNDKDKNELFNYFIFKIKNFEIIENLIKVHPRQFNCLNKDSYNRYIMLINAYLSTLKMHIESNNEKYLKDLTYYDNILNLLLSNKHSCLTIREYRNFDSLFKTNCEFNNDIDSERYYYFIMKWKEYFKHQIYNEINHKKKFVKGETFNELLYKYMIHKDFNIALQLESNEIYYNAKLNKEKSYKKIYTIDGEGSKELDDGFSCEKIDDYYRLGIHITNPFKYITERSPLFKEAYHRSTSIYYGDFSIPMYPKNLSEDLFSLNEGKVAYVLSLYLNIDNSMNIISSELKCENVYVAKNDKYNKCNELLQKQNINGSYLDTLNNINELEPFFNSFYNINTVYAYVNRTSANISKTNIIGTSKAEKMIEKLMLIYNHYIALIASKNNIPFIYRNHSLNPIYKEECDNYIEILHKKRYNTKFYENELKVLKQKYPNSYYDTICCGHDGLGLDIYSHSSSPIRRFGDNYNILMMEKFYLKHGSDMEYDAYQNKLKEVCRYLNEERDILENFRRECFYLKKKL